MKLDTNTFTSNFEFYVEVNGRPAREYIHENQVYLEGRKGSEYSLVFKNKTPSRILAVISVDGLSVLDGKVAGQESPGYVLAPHETLKIPGWTINQNAAARFQFQPQESGGADKTYVDSLIADGIDVSAQNQGVIGVLVLKEVPQVRFRTPYYYVDPNPFTMKPVWNAGINTPHPGYDLNAGSFGLTASASVGSTVPQNSLSAGTTNVGKAEANVGLGTGFGQQVSFDTTSVTFIRDLSAPLWLGVMIYDTLKGLQRRGVNVSAPQSPIDAAFPGMSAGCRVPSGYKG